MFPCQRRERPEIGFGQSALPMGLGEDFLQHERVHVDHAVLQQVQRQHADFLVSAAIARHFAASGEIDEVVRPVPSLDGVVRIPTKPAMHSNMKPATYTDLKPATVPI